MDLLHNGNRISLPGVKRPGSGVDHTPPTPLAPMLSMGGAESLPPLNA